MKVKTLVSFLQIREFRSSFNIFSPEQQKPNFQNTWRDCFQTVLRGSQHCEKWRVLCSSWGLTPYSVVGSVAAKCYWVARKTRRSSVLSFSPSSLFHVVCVLG